MKKCFALIMMMTLLVIQGVSVTAAGEIPTERLLPRLVDEGDLLTDSEEEALNAKLDEISERQQCDVVIATVDTLGDKDAQAFADDFYDYNGYGYGVDRDGIILVVCMEYRDYAISTHGYGITAFTDAGISYIEDRFLPDLSAGDYAASFNTFADWCDAYLTQASTGEPYDVGREPQRQSEQVTLKDIAVTIPMGYLIGFVIALVIALVKKSSLKSVARKTQANAYMSQFDIARREDRFINSTTTSHTVSKASQERSSGGGGSSVHTSSSGSSHGGHSGKF